MPDRLLARTSIALVWLYQGLWCKVLGQAPRHQAVIASVPFLSPAAGHWALIALGLLESVIALWVLWGRRLRLAAILQTALLVAMNAGGVVWASHLIPDPAGMILQNVAFLVLVWIAAEDRHHAAYL